MRLTVLQSYELLAKHGCYVTEVCDKCGQLLGPVQYTRRGEIGVWCSRECRGIIEQPTIRKGGRPRKYSTPEKSRAAKTLQQREYRNVVVWKKPPCSPTETKDLLAQKTALSRYPLSPCVSTSLNAGGVR